MHPHWNILYGNMLVVVSFVKHRIRGLIGNAIRIVCCVLIFSLTGHMQSSKSSGNIVEAALVIDPWVLSPDTSPCTRVIIFVTQTQFKFTRVNMSVTYTWADLCMDAYAFFFEQDKHFQGRVGYKPTHDSTIARGCIFPWTAVVDMFAC